MTANLSMEGYTDISVSLDSFDDLDIEGKTVTDDWNSRDDSSFKPKNSKQTKNQPIGFDEKALLSEKVLLNDGSQGFCFTVKELGGSMRWTCHVCNLTVSGSKNFQAHLLGKKHEGNMLLPHHDRSNFTKILNKKEVDKLQLAPGEPVPPGFEDEVEAVLQIQKILDNYKMSPLIGLEYLVELVDSNKEPQYNCMLCNKKGDPRTVMAHLTSQNHRLSYIEKHFTLTFNAINNLPKTLGAKKGVSEIVSRVASKIEEKYGRLPPVIADSHSFESKRETLLEQIEKGSHFSEAPDDIFVDLVDKNLVTMGIKADEVPPTESKPAPEPEDDDEVEFQGAFIKGTRVAVDRSALRVRNVENMLESEDKKTSLVLKKAAETKKKKIAEAFRSLSPLSTISSESSLSVRTLRRTRSRSPSTHRRMRSRSRSRSRSRNRLLRQRYPRRSRSISRGRRRRSRSRSHSRRRSRSGSRGRRRSPYGLYRNSRSTRDINLPRAYRDHKKDDRKEKVEDLSTEKAKWERFREDCDRVEKELRDELKYHEKNPEKHPQYPEEWKLFWNRRYKELQSIGIDPGKHDFKPEWIEFWNRRMREMHEAEFTKKKEEIRERLGLPPDNPDPSLRARVPRKRPVVIDHLAELEPISPDEEKRDPVAEMKSTWKAFTGSDIRDSKRSRSPSPWEENIGRGRVSPDPRRGPKEMRLTKETDFGSSRYRREPSRSHQESVRTISVLRTLTALENQLGSLGPKVNTLLSEAIALDKVHSGNSDAILANDENCVLFETIKEKLKGQLYAGIIDRNMIAPTKQAIQSITDLLAKAPTLLEHVKPIPAKIVEPVVVAPVVVAEPPVISEPVTVPGIGAVDKIAIAQQIAAALVAQGKTDVTHEELEQLINAVVGMAEASVDAQKPISTAEFVNSLTKTAEAPAAAPAPATASPLDGNESIGGDENSRSNSRSLATPSEDRRSVSSDLLGPIETLDGAEVRSTTSIASTLVATSSVGPLSITTSAPPLVSSNLVKSVTTTTVATESKRALNESPPPVPKTSMATRLVRSGYGHEDLTEDDLKMLLQNFKDLSTEEQHGLIVYLKKLEATDMDRVEKLRKFVNLGPPAAAAAPPAQAAAPAAPPKRVETTTTTTTSSRSDSGPLSPFSLRQGGANPTRDLDAKRAREEALAAKLMELDDSDDDYTFEDVYAAASQKVKEKMAEEERKAKEKLAEETKAREEREKERLENEEQDRREKEERERKEKEQREKWESDKAAISAAAMATAPSNPVVLRSQEDHSMLLKETTDVLDDLMGNLPSRFNSAKQAAAAASTAAANAQLTSGMSANARPIPIAGALAQPVESVVNPPYSNYYGNPSYSQAPQPSQPIQTAANGYNNFYNQGDQYRQLVYPGQQNQNQVPTAPQNQVPVPMAQQNSYPPQPVHSGYYPNQPATLYQGQNYQNSANYQDYNTPQQIYGQGYGQQMYSQPQQPGQYGQYNQQSYY